MPLTAATLVGMLPAKLRRHRVMTTWMRLTREDPVQLVRIRDQAFAYADMSDGFLRLIPIEGDFEADFFRIADAFCANGGTFLDVGANHGLFSFGLAHRHPETFFHLFEPNPLLVRRIQRSKLLYPRMHCTISQTAVAERSGQLSFNIVADQTGTSRLDPNGSTVVDAVALDEYLAQNSVREVRLLKIDIEGYELLALRGAVESIRSRLIEAVYFEFFAKNIENICKAEDIFNFFEDVDFILCFCRRHDMGERASHTIAEGYPGHGVPLSPVDGRTMPPATDLLAVPSERLVIAG